MTRLKTLSDELVSDLGHATNAARRRAAVTACAIAIEISGLDDSRPRAALETLQGGRVVTSAELQELRDLLEELDIAYLDAYEAAESGEAPEERYIEIFGKARAVAALVFAAQGDGEYMVSESIYEAAAAGDPNLVLSAVQASLRESDSCI